MAENKSFTVHFSTKGAVMVALGAGVLCGAGTAYLITRINEHTHLTQQISSLHNTILEVKRDIAALESGLSQKDVNVNDEDLSRSESLPLRKSGFSKKTVSFCSSTTSESYKTAVEYDTDSSKANDTDYYSPDEDDDEFFDISPDDSDRGITFGRSTKSEQHHLSTSMSAEEAHLCHLLEQVDILSDGSGDDQTQAFSLLKRDEQEYAKNAEFLWRLAKATKNMASIQGSHGNNKEKESLIFEAYGYAARALELDSNNPDVQKWYGILAGERGEFLGMRERIRSGSVFKEHIDCALKLKPQDSTLHHLLGRFCFEVAKLSWIERSAANALFGEIPSGTYEEALQHFLAAEDLRPSGWKENRLFVAKCYMMLNDNASAASWLQQAAEAPIITPDDEIVQKEVSELRRRCS